MRRKSIQWMLITLLVLGVSGVIVVEITDHFHRPSTTDVANLPRDAVVVAHIDVARLRAFPPVQRLTAWVKQRSEIRGYDVLVRDCRFDPFDRVDQLSWSIDGGVGQLGPLDSLLVFDGASIDTDDTTRCLNAWTRRTGTQPLQPAGTVDSRETFSAPAATWLDPASGPPHVALLEHGALLTSAAFLPRALAAVVDGTGPRLSANPTMRDALRSIDPDPVAFWLLDARAVPALTAAGTTRSIPNAAGALVPAVAAAALALGSAQTYAWAVTVVSGGGLKITGAVRLASPDDATRTAARLSDLWSQWGGTLRQLVRGAEVSYLVTLRSAQSRNAALQSSIDRVQAALDVINRVLETLTIRADGAVVRLQVPLSADDVTSFEGGIRGAIECNDAIAPHGASRP
jgi:hypothetical protein